MGQIYTLSEIKRMINAEKFEEIINNPALTELFLKSINKDDLDLGDYQIPKSLPYYIKRKLTIRRKLNPIIFRQECSDIFLIEGIERHHLSILAKPKSTDISSKQLKQVTERFILLKYPGDYEKIIKLTSSPVHRIQHQNNQFFWISTSGSRKMIAACLEDDLDEIDEKNWIKENLSTFNTRPIAICSSAGMGKSTLLANFANEMRNLHPQRFVIYLELRVLITSFSSIGPEMDQKQLNRILVSSPSLSSIGKQLLLDLINNRNTLFEICLDGFDEVSSENLTATKEILKYLVSTPNMRIYITSRPHMRIELEDTLEVVCLDIAPLNRDNQVTFLCDIWELNLKISSTEKLKQFATTVLDSLQLTNKLKNSPNDCIGIPLQCYMAGQIYTQDAERHIQQEIFYIQSTTSLYELYSTFITSKFKHIEDEEKQLIKLVHYRECIKLMFSDSENAIQILQVLEQKLESEQIPWDKIFAIGILEPRKNSSMVGFVHGTFADYLLAQFIVDQLLISPIVGKKVSVKFIVDSVLKICKTTKGVVISGTD